MSSVVVLFCAQDSVYKTLGLDCYDVVRDARTYGGENSVIAHPPCQLWGALAHVNYKRWGGEHNKPGNDGGLFKFALDTVNRCGGVLEHPAKSSAFKKYGLQRPEFGKWLKSGDGWVTEVWQSAYGHRARKATWLYFVSIHGARPFDLVWEKPEVEYQVGCCDRRGKERNKKTLSKREANATPILFARELIKLATRG